MRHLQRAFALVHFLVCGRRAAPAQVVQPMLSGAVSAARQCSAPRFNSIRIGAVLLALACLAPMAPAQNFLKLFFGGHHNGGVFQLALGHKTQHHICDASCRRYEPAHWTIVTEQVRVPGACRQVWVPPVYRTELSCCGNPIQVLCTPGWFRTVRDADRFETRRRRVWVPARWVNQCGDC